MYRNEDQTAVLSHKDFLRLSHFIHAEFGIKMPEAKKVMLQSRLLKRLRMLGMQSFGEYCAYLFSPRGRESELHQFIDVVTTNKTDFFREPAHFEFLVRTALPEIMASRGAGIWNKLMVWSAGCSTGEEPYTLAMIISEFAEHYPGFAFNWSILATDISTLVLKKAATAVYEAEKVKHLPELFKKKYLLKSKDASKGLVRIVPELRKMVRVRTLNFLDEDLGLREMMDIIFCRNVIIYFDKSTQSQLLSKFCKQLVPGGYIFMGHSETLQGLDVALVPVAPTVYRKPL
jgi:chemotaxis protein methyltransferase CheR